MSLPPLALVSICIAAIPLLCMCCWLCSRGTISHHRWHSEEELKRTQDEVRQVILELDRREDRGFLTRIERRHRENFLSLYAVLQFMADNLHSKWSKEALEAFRVSLKVFEDFATTLAEIEILKERNELPETETETDLIEKVRGQWTDEQVETLKRFCSSLKEPNGTVPDFDRLRQRGRLSFMENPV